MPSASPISQCGLGVNPKLGFSPHGSCARLSASLAPRGVEAWGTLGTWSSSASNASRVSAASVSASLMRSLIAPTSAFSASASSPALTFGPISLLFVLRS
jgi:hypothetical protein